MGSKKGKREQDTDGRLANKTTTVIVKVDKRWVKKTDGGKKGRSRERTLVHPLFFFL